ncbi:MAG: response regulator [Campylobacterota bacterium]|nr:response regulator [Campylobacterota bacterium]
MDEANKYTILIVDDEKVNIELAAIYLQEVGYKVSFALNAEAALESVMKRDIDLILLDINMPNIDGFKVCELLKADKKSKEIPIVFLTAQTDIEYISKAFELGGVDYISKPFNGVELKARVKTHLQTLSNLKEIKEKQSKLAQLTITDPLTKLYNALYFDTQIKAFATKNSPYWFVYIKIDRFNKINELYGFSGGNRVIKKFAKLLEDITFSNSVLARLYGSSFGILIKDYEQKEINGLHDRLLQKYAKDKDLSKLISFSAVFYRVKDSDAPTQAVYKKIQTSMQKLQDTDDKYIFIS